MHIEHHPIIREFPEHRDAIHNLKMADAHFKHQLDDYEILDKAIVRVENGDERLDDLALALMKRQRLSLKDAIKASLDKA